mmetsp:Transcript_47630/g.109570  ORF Transcript_47630/g.109570 Transcript_47630/m.109570 type:complete len:231 (+) Transcript_47630:442-1134(+)
MRGAISSRGGEKQFCLRRGNPRDSSTSRKLRRRIRSSRRGRHGSGLGCGKQSSTLAHPTLRTLPHWRVRVPGFRVPRVRVPFVLYRWVHVPGVCVHCVPRIFVSWVRFPRVRVPGAGGFVRLGRAALAPHVNSPRWRTAMERDLPDERQLAGGTRAAPRARPDRSALRVRHLRDGCAHARRRRTADDCVHGGGAARAAPVCHAPALLALRGAAARARGGLPAAAAAMRRA